VNSANLNYIEMSLLCDFKLDNAQ